MKRSVRHRHGDERARPRNLSAVSPPPPYASRVVRPSNVPAGARREQDLSSTADQRSSKASVMVFQTRHPTVLRRGFLERDGCAMLVGVAEVVDEHVLGAPTRVLRETVGHYSGYRQRNVAPALHRGLPSPYLTLIFTIDEPLHIAQHVDSRQTPDNYDALVGGLHTSPAYVRHDGAQSGVQVYLNPLAARHLLNMPAGELADVDLSAELVLGRAVDEVRQGLLDAAGWPARFAVVDRVLARQLRDAPAPPAEVRWVWSRLLATGGRVGVAELAREVGWSERDLAARLREETGLTPKRAGRVIRFDRARRCLQRVGAGDLARLAVDCGYADQSHMSREFAEMAGAPPGRWLAAEFGNVQSPASCHGHAYSHDRSNAATASVAHAARP